MFVINDILCQTEAHCVALNMIEDGRTVSE